MTKKKRNIIILIIVAILILAFWKTGFYTIQPIGALPEGITAWVWRSPGEPFFNSPDAVCLEAMGGVSLMCRMTALGEAPTDRIIARLPYMEWFYLRSTGGLTFTQ